MISIVPHFPRVVGIGVIAMLSALTFAGCGDPPRSPIAAPDVSSIGLYVVVIKQPGDVASFSEQHWVRVNRVVPASPAAVGGIKVGDILLKISGESVSGAASAMQLISTAPVGRPLKIAVLREGEPRDLVVTPKSRTEIFSASTPSEVNKP